MEVDEAIRAYSSALYDYVHHPDYYEGRWATYCTVVQTGEAGRRVCESYAEAKAFVEDLVRRGVCTPGDGKYRIWFERADPLPGFPRELETTNTEGGA